MNHKEITLLEPTSKSATFSTDSLDATRDNIVGFALTTTSQSSLDISVQFEASFDDSNWVAIGFGPYQITTNTTVVDFLTNNPYPYLRLTATWTAGSATIKVLAHTKSF